MSQFLPLIRDRLSSIAAQAATAGEALDQDGDAISLDSCHFAELLRDLDGAAARIGAICERLAASWTLRASAGGAPAKGTVEGQGQAGARSGGAPGAGPYPAGTQTSAANERLTPYRWTHRGAATAGGCRGRCDLRARHHDANLRRCVRPKRAMNIVLSADVDVTEAPCASTQTWG
jgi:hypothetical protein